MNEETQRALVGYLEERDAVWPKATVDEPLFVRHDGREVMRGITRKTVWLVVHTAGEHVAGTVGVSPHDFRRYIACW